MIKNKMKNLIKYLPIIVLIFGVSCGTKESVIRENVFIKIYADKDTNNIVHASALPKIKPESRLMKYEKRFNYLLMNVPEIHHPDKAAERQKIFDLYPDTLELKKLDLEKYVEDKKLTEYFEETIAPINNPDLERKKTYTVDELMEVASKFFYCDLVNPDTTIQAHVCVGMNGVKEANWEKDYTLLAAFCFEAIFTSMDNEHSKIWDSFVSKKQESAESFKKDITTLDKYLNDVKTDLFKKMKNNEILKKELLDHYESNKNNLAFIIIK
jgi:hypothetical protein